MTGGGREERATRPPAEPGRVARAAALSFRRPTEDDYERVVGVVDDWWDGRSLHRLLPRLWFQHFTGTSWLAEDDAGRLAGFLVGFRSPDQPNVAYCHMIATDPNLRGAGLGRALYERFFDDARAGGAHEVRAVTWPGNRRSVAFHRAMGFRILTGPGTQNLYGTPSTAGYDYGTEDRVLLAREV
ncbi:MAG: GNAT family N-acetyltransferase [Chloroflexi bacterium]|nr:GNAT family N-acetyltransferase [Chloroflexota bacterium]